MSSEGATPLQQRGRPVRWPLYAVFLSGFGLLALGLVAAPNFSLEERLPVLGGIALVAAAWAGAYRLRGRWWPAAHKLLEEHTDALDALPERRLGWWIGLAAGSALFAELVLIRWHASTFQLFAYFKNVSLLAAFLGIGIGYALGRRRPVLTPLVLPAFALQFVLLYCLRFSSVQDLLQSPVSENMAFGIGRVSNLRVAPVTYGFLILVFAFTVLTCVPLGQVASRLMLRRPPLVAYSCNLLGSLAGIGLFTLLCYAWAPPAVWLILTIACLVPFLLLGQSRFVLVSSLACSGVALSVLALPFRTDLLDVYSPYQVLSLQVPRADHPNVQVNHVYYQRIFDLSHDTVRSRSDLKGIAECYEWPYNLKPAPERVLVVGAGTGNDVAAGLRRNAGHVDAVEIDPAILGYGKQLHPEKPYQDERVEAIVEDARTFLRRTDRSYDLIVYGLLDSHTLLSGRSSVRLDSFVYTVEGLREARARLRPDGMVSLTFCLLSRPLGRKLYLMLQEAFDGQEPRAFETPQGTIFVVGPGMPTGEVAGALREVTAEFRSGELRADVSTDDWPFLYMPVRKYPVSCLAMIAVLLVVALLLLYQLLPTTGSSQESGVREEGRAALGGRDTGTGWSFSPACFFLGAGFMLLETKGITELGLLFGNTWEVISVVIAAILVMAFLANLLCRPVSLPPFVTYGLLLGAVVLGLAFPASSLTGLSAFTARGVAAGLITLPLFFSGLAFSRELKGQANVSAALSSNLLGAMLGGFCEYNSMYFGFRSLSVFALVLYGLAIVGTVWVAWAKRARPQEGPEALPEQRHAA
jgi:SAM-dependent methyltransferase